VWTAVLIPDRSAVRAASPINEQGENMKSIKKQEKELEQEKKFTRRMEEIRGAGEGEDPRNSVFHLMAEKNIKNKQREECWRLVGAEANRLEKSVRQCVRAQMGLKPEVLSDSTSGSASGSASASGSESASASAE
jgi:hypothetical protein